LAFEAQTLRQVGAFNTTPHGQCAPDDGLPLPCGKKGGVWQASNPLMSDSELAQSH
jgi:hypothetical protein